MTTVQNICGLMLSFLFFSLPFVSFSATGIVNVQTSVGGDLIPPSAPVGLAATPVATTQIDLAWNPASDNEAVAGYHVWRDAVQVATTSATMYADTGLSPSTSYTYHITAFDTSGNISASSAPVTGSTLDPIPPHELDTSTEGSKAVPFTAWLGDLQIVPREDAALVLYETDEYIRTTMRWGRTISYEGGWLREDSYRTVHSGYIPGLIPDTLYHIRIEGERPNGRGGVLYDGTFRTVSRPDLFPPGNVWDLQVLPDGDSVVLTWKNPPDPDFAKVRIVRNTVSYPSDAVDGWVIYEGKGTEVRDTHILEEIDTVYYSVFAYDEKGNMSSGAVVRYAKETGDTGIVMSPYENSAGLMLDTVVLVQDGEDIPWLDGTALVDASKPFLLRIPYGEMPEHLKTIVAVIRRRDATHSVLLRINAERSAYESVMSPFGNRGSYPLQISVINNTDMQVGYAEGVIVAYEHQHSAGLLQEGGKVIKSLVGASIMMLLIAVAYFLRKSFRAM